MDEQQIARIIFEQMNNCSICDPDTQFSDCGPLRAARAVLAAVASQQPLDKAPTDEWVLLADSGGYVNQAIFGEDEENPRWRLAGGGFLHPNFEPLWWMPMPVNDSQGA